MRASSSPPGGDRRCPQPENLELRVAPVGALALMVSALGLSWHLGGQVGTLALMVGALALVVGALALLVSA